MAYGISPKPRKPPLNPLSPKPQTAQVWYGSETGTAERLALRAAEALGSQAAVSAPPPWDQAGL